MKKIAVVLLLILLFVQPFPCISADFPFTFTDSTGAEITLSKQPSHVVSLVPTVTEMLLRLGVEDKIIGLTHHSVLPPESAGKNVIGGFFSPDVDRVAALGPDVIFYADLHRDKLEQFRGKMVLINLSSKTLTDSISHLRLLADVFDKKEAAGEIINEENRLLDLIDKKTEGITAENKQRVMRLMGRTSVMTPGEDSFQNEYIRAAGAIPPSFGKKGAVVPVTLAEWQEFDPQFLYGCGGDREILEFIDQPGWRDVKAVQNKNYYFFPCDLTCRAATHTGYFVAWLAASIYHDEFSNPEKQVLPEEIVERSPISLDLDYVKVAEIMKTDIRDFRNKSVRIEFNKPMTVISTLEGQRDNILQVGNHYFPPPAWGLDHIDGLEKFKSHNLNILGLSPESTSFLFTGADMDNLAIVKKSFKEMEVTALITAGVAGNAVRMAHDTGAYYEPDHLNKNTKPGTINIMVLSNMQLSPRAMTRAIISATEAKSAAMQDMDIRSSYSSTINPATGTGTDNVLVVEGSGIPIDASGGHTKMGELIARAVYNGVRKAVHMQNGFTEKRTIFQRLKERKTSVRKIGKNYGTPETALQLERLMLDPVYSSFVEAALSISDDYERNLVKDLTSFDGWCVWLAEQLAGKEVDQIIIEDESLPVVLRKAFGALISGLEAQDL